MRPARPFLTARWLRLAMLNYVVPPEILLPHVPAGTELDSHDGRTFLSVVGFQFLDTRVLGLPVPLHRDFEEVNLRFYVGRQTDEGRRRGVVFVKELVPRFAIAWAARTLYNENYLSLPMSHRDEIDDPASGQLEYGWYWRSRWNRLAVRVTGDPERAGPCSEEAFITEHYWGYSRQRDGSTLEYQVEHPTWRVWQVKGAELDCDAGSLYGPEFVESLGRAPSSAFVADGSEVVVRAGLPLA